MTSIEAELITRMREFEQREECDLRISFMSDGSGSVQAPVRAPEPIEVTVPEEDLGMEEVFAFENPEALIEWLEHGTLPEHAGQGAGTGS